MRARNGDIDICYETLGDPDGVPLMLVHGLGSSLLVWDDEMCAGFVDRGFFVLRMDNRDSGLSTVLDAEAVYTLDDMVADVVAVLDDAGCDRVIVCGYSLGGMIAQQLAILHPQRVAGLVSLASSTSEAGIGEPTSEARVALTAAPQSSIDAQVEADLEAHRIWSNPEWHDEQAMRSYFERSYRRAWHPGAAKRQFDAAVRTGSRAEQLRDLEVPALVIHGSLDALIGPDAGRRTAELIDGATYLEIEGMGHELPPQVWSPIISAVTALSSRIFW